MRNATLPKIENVKTRPRADWAAPEWNGPALKLTHGMITSRWGFIAVVMHELHDLATAERTHATAFEFIYRGRSYFSTELRGYSKRGTIRKARHFARDVVAGKHDKAKP